MQQAWPLAIVVSVGIHGALLTVVALHWGARDFAQQTRPEARLNIADQRVTASTAKPAEPMAAAAIAASSKGPFAGEVGIPQSTAAAIMPPSVAATLIAALPATPPTTLPFDAAAQVPAAGALLRQATPNTTPAPTAPASSLPAPALALPFDAAAPISTASAPLRQATPNTTPASTAPAVGLPAPALALPSERSAASLAWSGDAQPLDPVSLAAIQAFMQPGDLTDSETNAGNLRDGIAITLAAVPCARLQTSFDPETGSVELRGHLPQDGLRAPVLAALRAQIGRDIPVTDRMHLLPRPQCQALDAIVDVGLAQSTEQDTNPRVVGADTFVRDYSLTAGQRLVFDMTAPDYPAVIYVDYFDAAGNVLHMQPNDQVPAVLSAAKSTLAVGQDAPGVPALQLIVGPPFGQEIAVAFATSVPLYAGVRPTVEPAAAYLEFLKQAVAQARAKTPDFKGEWVYFMVATAP